MDALDKCVVQATTKSSNRSFFFFLALPALQFGLKSSQHAELSSLAFNLSLILRAIQGKLTLGCKARPHNPGCQERSTTVLQGSTPLVTAQFWNSRFPSCHTRVFCIRERQFFALPIAPLDINVDEHSNLFLVAKIQKRSCYSSLKTRRLSRGNQMWNKNTTLAEHKCFSN